AAPDTRPRPARQPRTTRPQPAPASRPRLPRCPDRPRPAGIPRRVTPPAAITRSNHEPVISRHTRRNLTRNSKSLRGKITYRPGCLTDPATRQMEAEAAEDVIALGRAERAAPCDLRDLSAGGSGPLEKTAGEQGLLYWMQAAGLVTSLVESVNLIDLQCSAEP